MKPYLNIHSHQASSNPDNLTVVSLYNDFGTADDLDFCSIGLHPWHLNDLSDKMKEIEQRATEPNILAIGECGLDKACDTPWNIQEQAFEWQIELANRLKKPLIIHCVRAFSEAIAILKSAKVPVIFHGFQKHPELAQELISHNFYLSFGKALYDTKENAIESFKIIPADRFFLETDNSTLAIQDIYKAAAALRNISENELIEQIQQNYKTVFKL